MFPCCRSFDRQPEVHRLIGKEVLFRGLRAAICEKWRLKNGVRLLLTHPLYEPPDATCKIGISVPAGFADDPSLYGKTAKAVARLLHKTFKGELAVSITLDSTIFELEVDYDKFPSTLSRFFSLFHRDRFCPFDVSILSNEISEELQHDILASIQKSDYRLWNALLMKLKPKSLDDPYTEPEDLLAQWKRWFDCFYTAEGTTCIISTPKPTEEVRNLILDVVGEMRQKVMRKPKRLSEKWVSSSLMFVESPNEEITLSFVWSFFEDEISEQQHPLYLLCVPFSMDYSGGLLNTFRSLGWASHCEAKLEKLGNQLPTLFSVRLKLTKQGAMHWREIGSHINSFMKKSSQLSDERIKEFISCLHAEEVSKSKSLPFPIKETLLALSRETLRTFPSQEIDMSRLDPNRCRAFIQNLLDRPQLILMCSPLREWKKIQHELMLNGYPSKEIKEWTKNDYHIYECLVPLLEKSAYSFRLPCLMDLRRMEPLQMCNLQYINCLNN